MKRDLMTFQFVEFIPKEQDLEEGTVYISITYSTAVHKCCSGCGYKIVTPISPTDWSLIFDRDTISLDPSIGNWSLPCKSHYWITRNKVVWAAPWTKKQIEAGKAQDRRNKKTYYNSEPSEERQSEVARTDGTISRRFRKRPTNE